MAFEIAKQKNCEVTGISLSKNHDAKSIYEQNIEKQSSKLEDFKKSDLAKEMEEAFPDAKLLKILEEGDND